MKIIATAAAALTFAIPARCEPPAPKPPNPPAHQQTPGATLTAQAACSVFTAQLTNSSRGVQHATIYVDGLWHDIDHYSPGELAEFRVYLHRNTGDHTVAVVWLGGTSTYRVPTDGCV